MAGFRQGSFDFESSKRAAGSGECKKNDSLLEHFDFLLSQATRATRDQAGADRLRAHLLAQLVCLGRSHAQRFVNHQSGSFINLVLGMRFVQLSALVRQQDGFSRIFPSISNRLLCPIAPSQRPRGRVAALSSSVSGGQH